MSLARDISVMRRAPLLNVFEEEQLKLIAFGSERLQHRRGGVLFEAGAPAPGATVVLFGQLQVSPAGREGDAAIVGVGALLDGVSMFVEAHHAATAVARVETEVLRISRATMLRVLTEFPEYAAPLQTAIANASADLMRDLDAVTAALSPH